MNKKETVVNVLEAVQDVMSITIGITTIFVGGIMLASLLTSGQTIVAIGIVGCFVITIVNYMVSSLDTFNVCLKRFG